MLPGSRETGKLAVKDRGEDSSRRWALTPHSHRCCHLAMTFPKHGASRWIVRGTWLAPNSPHASLELALLSKSPAGKITIRTSGECLFCRDRVSSGSTMVDSHKYHCHIMYILYCPKLELGGVVFRGTDFYTDWHMWVRERLCECSNYMIWFSKNSSNYK